MLVDGRWVGRFAPAENDANELDKQGGFVRQQSQFRRWVGRTPGFEVEPGRYHLYVAMICPWACRTLMVRALKGLEKVIGVTKLAPVLTEQGWRFEQQPSELGFEAEFLHQLYSYADGHYSGRATVPVLWDKQQQTIVSNESADIIRMFNEDFGPLATKECQLRPPELEQQLEQLATYYYDGLNNGVYKAGFAHTQQAYDQAVEGVFAALAELEAALEGNRYRLGGQLTELDVRLFVTLARFEPAYYSLFKCNLRRLDQYPNICGYMQRIYSLPGIAQTVDVDSIKRGYYSIEALNPGGIVPRGPLQCSFHQVT